MTDLKTKKDLLKKIYHDMDELKPYKDMYYELFHEADELAKDITNLEQTSRLGKLSERTQYRECSYPTIGLAGEDGSAVFEDHDTAEALLDALRARSNYYFGFSLEWDGPGEYKIVPTFGHDRDGETVYTTIFMKD